MPAVRTSVAGLVAVALVAMSPHGAVAASPRDPLERVVASGAPGAMAYLNGHTRAAGVASLRTRRPLRARDRVRIGSITKSFTAVVALQLVGEGRLRLSDTVGDRLPGVLPSADSVTLRQLLNHTSGIPDDVVTPLLGILHGNPLRIWTPAQVLALVRDAPLRFRPGTGWAYSNTDYVLAGLMIERASGHSLVHELKRRVVRPLNLRHTSFPVHQSDLGRDAARGYSLDIGPDGPLAGALRDVTRYSPSFAWASGNGVSTIGEVARFYRALLRGRLLSPPLLHQALTTGSTDSPRHRYGLGLDVYPTRDGTLIGHDGDMPGFSIKARSSRDARLQAVVATNAKYGLPPVDDALDVAIKAELALGRRM